MSDVAQAADRSAVVEAWRELGRLLAARRNAAGLTQFGLADRVPWSRSTIANVEANGQQVTGDFWQHCDVALGAGGELVTAWQRVAALADRCRAEAAEESMRQRLAAFTARLEGGPVAAVVAQLPPDAAVVHVAVPVGVAVTVTYGKVGELPGTAVGAPDGANDGEPVRVVLPAAAGETDTVTVVSELLPAGVATDGTRVYALAARREVR